LRGETTFSPLTWPYTLQTFFYGYSFGPSLRELHQPDRLAVLKGSLPLLLAGAVPVAVGLVSGLRRQARNRGLLLVWIFVPLLILTLLALRNVKPWNPRYVIMVLPWVLALAAGGFAALPRRWGVGATVLLTGLTLWSLGGYYGNGRYAKADVRAAAAYLEEANSEGAPVVAPVITTVFKYYYQGAGEVIDSFGLPVLRDEEAAASFCDRTLAGRTRCWLVLAREWYFDPEDHLPRALSRRGHLRLVFTGPGVRTYYWDQMSTGDTEP
jgi:hypothetical protein